MDENIEENNQDQIDPSSESFRKIQETLPNASESFGSVRKGVTETFGNIPKRSERTAYHTLSVRDVAKIFESASFPITERTVINRCNQNKRGIKRLDCFFDEHDGKYFITTHRVDKALKEEAEKNAQDSSTYEDFSESFRKIQETLPNASESFGSVRKGVTETFGNIPKRSERYVEPQDETMGYTPGNDKEVRFDMDNEKRIKELEQEVLDLKITNKGKDYFIDQLKQDREAVVQERAQLVSQLTASVKEIGVLETKLMQLEAPRARIIDAGEGDRE